MATRRKPTAQPADRLPDGKPAAPRARARGKKAADQPPALLLPPVSVALPAPEVATDLARAPAAHAPDSTSLADAVRQLREASAQLIGLGDGLTRTLSEVPKATDFQPLADHLYAFATLAPRLTEALQAVPEATTAAQESTRVLGEISETLQFTHERFSEVLVHLPRAEDYEPLVGPLREFAKVAPSLAEALAEVVRVSRPLSESVRGLQELGASLRTAAAETAPKPSPAPAGTGTIEANALAEALDGLRQAAACLTAGRDAIRDALSTLPSDPAYAPVARQLRELATVSPSLMAWLTDVPKVAAPLVASVDALASAARNLDAGLRAALECVARLTAGPPVTEPRTDRD